MIAAWAGKEKPPTPGRESGEWCVKGVQVINGNPVKAQAVKGKERTAIFKQLKAAGFTPSSVLVMPDGIIKIQFGERAVSAANDDEPNPWHK